MSAAAIGTAIAIAYPIIESIIHETNSKKASKLRKQLGMILSKYNLSINELRTELERRGVSHNLLMESLSGVSPVGKAFELKREANSEYHKSVKDINSQINRLTRDSELISGQINKQAENLESKGILRTITGDIINND